MNSQPNPPLQKVPDHLKPMADMIWTAAQGSRHETQALLEILRVLEHLHREIRDELFQATLPTNRHSLYDLLRDIETHGEWPYIPRMRLQSLLEKLDSQLANDLLSSADRSPSVDER